jgi:prepilin-type N-terminal cleavage/methylation domain-containing protein
MNRRGFTIVELIIVITIMSALLVLGVVNLRGSRTSADDAERRVDIETIATQLETFYNSGNYDLTPPIPAGTYPSVDPTKNLIGNETTMLSDINPDSLKTPGATSSSLIAATCTGLCVQTTAGVTPQPTISQYVYQPIESGGALCNSLATQECRKFNLYYKLEIASISTNCPDPGFVCMLTSKNQ